MNPEQQVRLQCLMAAVEIVKQTPREDAADITATSVLQIALRLQSFVIKGKVEEVAP